MATARDTEIIASVLSKILNDDGYAFDNIFTKVPLVHYMLAKDNKDSKTLGTNNRVRKLDGGLDIEIPLEYAVGSSMQFFDNLDVITFAQKGTMTNAKYDWKHAAQTLLMDNKDILKCKGESRKITNLVGSKLRNMNRSMATSINTALLAITPGSKDFHSIPEMVAKTPTSGTVGGINRATASNSWWRNKIKSSSATTYELLIKDIDNLRNTIAYNMAGDAPDLMLTDQIVFEYIIAYMRAKGTHTFNNEEMSNVLGVDVKKARGMDLIWDTGVPILDASKSTIYLLNTDYLQFCVHEDRQFALEGPQKLIFAQGQDATAWVVFLMGNMTTSNSSKQGVIYNIAQNIAA